MPVLYRETDTGVGTTSDEAASVPCWGFFDDCDDVVELLEKIKKYSSLKTKINLKPSKDIKEKMLIAKSIKIGGIDYAKIRILYMPLKGAKIIFDPKNSFDYKQNFFNKDGTIDQQFGIAYMDGKNVFFRILIDNEQDEITKREALKNYLFGISQTTLKESTDPTKIIIKYSRKGRNKYRTWGTFVIEGTDYNGFILERPKGDNPTQLEDYKRHPSGTYNLGYSENSGGIRLDFYNVTLYIVEHPGYKLHNGNRADDSEGCLLINIKSPQNDPYPGANKFVDPNIPVKDRVKKKKADKASVANTYYEPNNENSPAKKLRDKVFEMEKNIKEKYKLKKVEKKIIIDESIEIEEP